MELSDRTGRRLKLADLYVLHERKLDLVIMRRFGALAGLFDEAFVVAAGAQSPWARRRRIALAELVSESWVLPRLENPFGAAALEAFRASGIDYPRATAVIEPMLVRISLLATGRFLTICSPSILRFPSRRQEIKVLPVDLPIAPVPVGIVTLKNRTLSPVAQLFIDSAREVAKPLARRE
jgi:DNA-binding transcriptional LysR family regulator